MSSDDPLALVDAWLNAARPSNPNGLVASFATCCRRSGRPSVRPLVLLVFSGGYFRFFTTGTSRKTEELRENPQAALHFWWPELNRTLRAEGHVTIREDADSRKEAFCLMRPEAQRAMSASGNPKSFTGDLEAIRARVQEMPVQVDPPDCGCVLQVRPDRLEFYESGADLIASRKEFRRDGDSWSYCLLGP